MTAEGSNVVQRIGNAWDCCGTCAGGVLAAHVREVVAQHGAEVGARALREAVLPIRRFAESKAITAKALGHDDRDWLDLLILCDRADALTTEEDQP